MRKIVILVSAVLLTASLWAQAPQKFSYQAVIRNASSALVANQKVGIQISILQTSATGVVVYTERHEPTTNSNGLATLEIGGGTVMSGDFTKIDWAKGPFYVRTEADPTGGTNYTISGESQLLSVPYALYAANGQQGPKGEPGPAGKDGVNGLDGKDGAQGPQGIQGPKGDKGDTGLTGPAGKDGAQGPKGPKGDTPQVKVSVSLSGDTLKFENGGYVIIPGISAANPKTKPTSGYGPNITDVEGNSYKTVYIGTQQWMAENLKVSKYNDGTTIPNVTDNTLWSNLTTGAWCNYNNSDSLGKIYGKLYNWYTVSNTTNGNKNVCPTGWHVPSDNEWTVLTDYLGGASVAGGKMKEVGTTNWNSPNIDATNSSFYTGLPGGYRGSEGIYNTIGIGGNWWSYSENTIYYAWGRAIYHNNFSAYRNNGGNKKDGVSIRCLKD